jgi:hypothetical protein
MPTKLRRRCSKDSAILARRPSECEPYHALPGAAVNAPLNHVGRTTRPNASRP